MKSWATKEMDFKKFFYKEDSSYKWLLTVAIVFFTALIMAVILLVSFNYYYADKAFPGIYLGDISLSGQTENNIKKTIAEKINNINKNGYTYIYQDQEKTILPIATSNSSDFAYELVGFDTESTLRNIFAIGRGQDFLANLSNRIDLFFNKKIVPLNYHLNEEAIKGILQNSFSGFDEPAQNAEISYNEPDGFSVKPEKRGQVLDINQGIYKLKEELSRGTNESIILNMVKSEPTIMASDCQKSLSEVNSFLNQAPIKLTYQKNTWTISRDVFAKWIDAKIYEAGTVNLGINIERASNYFSQFIAPKINIEPKSSKFFIVNGKVKEFQISQGGQMLDATSTIKKIEQELIQNKNNSIEVVVNNIDASLEPSEVDNLAIKDLIGVGESNFYGSSKNRRINIRVGANAVNGTLIKPDEEFSLLKTLGKIDGTTGYLQELVIKENKTIPEYGGGLCQIGTTVFRAAVDSGLPIIERRNHSYRVQYYEPAGTDAAIYDPAPDVKFLNDTGGYILIQSKIVGNKLTFEFWGTNDGRKVVHTKPVISNIVKPEPPKTIETDSLKPGEKKCTEKAHNGADAYFDYQVTYANGEIKNKRFNSHYVPWQEVCLIGKTNVASSTASTTNSIINKDAQQSATSTDKITEIPVKVETSTPSQI